MRIATEIPAGEEGFTLVRSHSGTRVLLNGEPVQNCGAADDETGEVWRAVKDEHLPGTIKAVDDEIVVERLTGKVVIELGDSLERLTVR